MGSSPNWHAAYVPPAGEWNLLWASKADASEVANLQITATGSTIPRAAADRAADVVNAKDFGVIADGVTDDTVALRAAIAAAQALAATGPSRRLQLPPGTIITQPLTLPGQIEIWGYQSGSTILTAKAGSAAPVITIQSAGTATPGGLPYDYVALRHLRITSADGKTGNAGVHGVSLVAGTRILRAVLDDVTIWGVSGDGVNSASFWGQLDTYDSFIFNNAGNGVTANSCFDWHFYGGQIGVNGGIGMQLSGSGQFGVFGMNIYANAINNLQLYSPPGSATGNHQFYGCMFDFCNQNGVSYGMAGTGTVLFNGCTFGGCSNPSPGTYSDFVIEAGANSQARFAACYWSQNHASDAAFPEKYALEFKSGTATVRMDELNYFLPGVLRTNATAGQVTGGAGSFTSVQAINPVQYSGVELNNGTNTVAKIYGAVAGNDTGVLGLYTGGTAVVQIAAGNVPNYINGSLTIGATTTPTATLMVSGTFSALGVVTQTASTPVWNSDDTSQASGLRRFVVSNNSQALQVYSATDAGVVGTVGMTIARSGLVTAPVQLKCGQFGANGNAASSKITISGSRGGATVTVLASLLTAMATYGLITDSTTA